MCKERGIEGGLTDGAQCLGVTVVHAVRGHVANTRVAVHGVVPSKERLAMRARILDAAKARGEIRPVLHGLEL